MTTYTKAELRTRVAQDLMIAQQGQALGAEDAAYIDQGIQAALEYLEDENLVIFDAQQTSSVSNIPAKVFLALTELIKCFCPALGGNASEQARNDALRLLRRSIVPGSTTAVTKQVYY